MVDEKSEYAARLICDPMRQEMVDVISTDCVMVHEVIVDGDVVTVIKTTQTTESALMFSLVNQIRKEHRDAKEN